PPGSSSSPYTTLFRSLPVDLDPQGNLSDYFGVEKHAFPTVREAMIGKATLDEAMHKGMVPASLSLAETELALNGRIGRELALKRDRKSTRLNSSHVSI